MAEFVFRMMALGDTALPRQGMGAISQQLASDVPVRLNSEDVASGIAWLLDPANSWVTGQVLGIDGGLGTLRPR